MTSSLGNDIYSCIEASLLFDREWYLAQNADVALSGVDPLHHYVSSGASEGRSPNSGFDAQWYRSTYPDAASEPNPLIHYIQDGGRRGYLTHPIFLNADLPGQSAENAAGLTPLGKFLQLCRLVEASYLFERDWYLDTYKDVAIAGVDPLHHYILSGASEKRNPSRAFNAEWYLSTYQDAVVQDNPLLHYLRDGARQGYTTHPGFPFAGLPRRLIGAGPSDSTPLGAFLQAWTLVESSFLFERDWYLDAYKDVASSGGDPLQHYLLHGVGEGRNPNRLFDTRWYLSKYPDVAEAGFNPLAHYIYAGAKLGYDPHPFFSTEGHRNLYGDGSTPGMLALEDFFYRIVRRDPSKFPKFSPYDVHRSTDENLRRRQYAAFASHVEIMTLKPNFIIIMAGGDDAARRSTFDSLAGQVYDRYRIIHSRHDALEESSESAESPDYIIWLEAGDRLDPDALYTLASALNADPELDLIYFDHSVETGDGRSEPQHKPDWSPDYLEAANYIGPAACFRLAKARSALSSALNPYDFLLRFTELDVRIMHLDNILMHLPRSRNNVTPDQEAADISAIAARLQRTHRTGSVRPNGPGSSSYNTTISLRDDPLVSIVIPTAGRIIDYGNRRVDLIVECIESITAISTYKNLEFIIVDNGDFDRERLSHIATTKLRYVTYALSEVNIAKKINLGVENAAGSMILILNDDVMPLVPDWIERMLGHFEKPHVGMVGAKLVYPNGTLQHVGMVACDGQLHHVRVGSPRDDRGYADSSCATRNYVAVTGAVSLTTRRLFEQAGGYPEELPIDYNDAHLCYRLRELGYSIVFEPQAELTHYHAVSAERSPRPQDFAYFSTRWAAEVDDPFYNQYYFSRSPPNYELRYTERSC